MLQTYMYVFIYTCVERKISAVLPHIYAFESYFNVECVRIYSTDMYIYVYYILMYNVYVYSARMYICVCIIL